MASDSEPDEFFDAPDATPYQSFQTDTPQNITTDEVQATLSEIEEEEKRLLDLKKAAEERRRREDEALQARLLELQRKKEEEEKKSAIQKQKVIEAEMRRRKLEEMREMIGVESTPGKSSQDSSQEDDVVDENVDSPVKSNKGSPTSKKSNTIEKMENSSKEKSTMLVHSRRQRSGSWGDLPKDTSVLVIQREQSESKLTTLQQNINVFHPVKETCVKTLDSDLSDDNNSCEIETLQVVDDVIKDSQLSGDEPDIIKSTKTRTPPNTLSQPVAPPRRKKSGRADSSTSGSSGANSLELPAPANITGRTSQDEQSLDLRHMIRDKGARHILAEDAELDAVKSDVEMPDDVPVFSVHEATDEEMFGDSDDENKGKKKKSDRVRRQKLSESKKDSPRDHPSSPEQPTGGRPRSSSGTPLTDDEILALVMVKNLDTGETIPLNQAEEHLPKCLNPLDLHIVQRTKEFSTDGHNAGTQSDEDDRLSQVGSVAQLGQGARRKTKKLRRLFGKTISKVKSAADHALYGDEAGIEADFPSDDQIFKIKASRSNKGPFDFSQPRVMQDLSGEHSGAIWTMKFSPCGRLLATGGQDCVLRIWVLRSAYSYFDDIRQRYSDANITPAHSQESLNTLGSEASSLGPGSTYHPDDDEEHGPFSKKPFCTYRGHSADLLDVSWSKNYFILSSSMDKTVRLWHISRRECLCTFQHIDFVTAIVFHPRDDRYFLSGSLDGKLRLWNIPDKKVTLWNEVSGSANLITTANFCQNGKYAVVGTYDGKCIFYTTEQLKYFTQIHVRSTRGRNARGHKVTGIEPVPGESKMLVTSNDSRIRLYDLVDLTLSIKYKGGTNTSSQIKAGFSPSGKHIICGSEDHFIYIWKTHHEFKFSSARRDRSDYWEAIKVHNAVVTAAIFAPNPSHFFKKKPLEGAEKSQESEEQREIIVSADFTGAIKIMTNSPCL
ncbi:WD repeat-containing protein 44-like isoform X1 [Haliotis asinina]|uniref:WD repeat-containing protein 44-like isoform X1 n=2 Tax=Haliotis asinina TaxID=109174 RepID=UPI003531AEE4